MITYLAHIRFQTPIHQMTIHQDGKIIITEASEAGRDHANPPKGWILLYVYLYLKANCIFCGAPRTYGENYGFSEITEWILRPTCP